MKHRKNPHPLTNYFLHLWYISKVLCIHHCSVTKNQKYQSFNSVTLCKETVNVPEILLPHSFPPQSCMEKSSTKEKRVTLQPFLSTATASRSLLAYVNYNTPKATVNCRGCKASPGIMRVKLSPSCFTPVPPAWVQQKDVAPKLLLHAGTVKEMKLVFEKEKSPPWLCS